MADHAAERVTYMVTGKIPGDEFEASAGASAGSDDNLGTRFE